MEPHLLALGPRTGSLSSVNLTLLSVKRESVELPNSESCREPAPVQPWNIVKTHPRSATEIPTTSLGNRHHHRTIPYMFWFSQRHLQRTSLGFSLHRCPLQGSRASETYKVSSSRAQTEARRLAAGPSLQDQCVRLMSSEPTSCGFKRHAFYRTRVLLARDANLSGELHWQ